MRRPRGLAALLLVATSHSAASALETDQFYAWGRPLNDSTDVLNAKINLEIDKALAQVNGSSRSGRMTCERVEKRIIDRFRYPIFQKIEVWALNTELVDRVPATPEEEFEFRERYLYSGTPKIDIVRWMPPSPTILVNGIRIGTDKLSHFFSEGIFYHWLYHRALGDGLDPEAAERRATRVGILTERTFLGLSSSGVLSRADLEANYEGMRFYIDLCDGDDPNLEKTPDGWILKRPFDLRDYVTPEWDESWQPSIYGRIRWRRVEPEMRRYCDRLDDPDVREQRRIYAERDRATLSEELVGALVEQGKLRDPLTYSIEAVCGRALAPLEAEADPR